MNIDQIAAEAAMQFDGTDHNKLVAIIKAAIEKAWQEGYKQGAVDESLQYPPNESRAAQASELRYDPCLNVPDDVVKAAYRVAHWATLNGLGKGWCIGPVCDRAAQVSEEAK